jgi:hypothetical protein
MSNLVEHTWHCQFGIAHSPPTDRVLTVSMGVGRVEPFAGKRSLPGERAAGVGS